MAKGPGARELHPPHSSVEATVLRTGGGGRLSTFTGQRASIQKSDESNDTLLSTLTLGRSWRSEATSPNRGSFPTSFQHPLLEEWFQS